MENRWAPISTLPANPIAPEEYLVMKKRMSKVHNILLVMSTPLMLLALSPTANASTAYGTLNNFDCVNDVIVNNEPVECHGFEIEIEDIHSTDITYTYDYNHYGIPKITEDSFVDANGVSHPRVTIRWAAKKNPDGTWTAYTAIPSGPISPTDGHQFTNPSVNFGGEHFGVGYYGNPAVVRNFWLIDDGAGNLVRGPLVTIAMPTFNYYPAVAQVQPVIEPPPPPEPPVLRFGNPVWVKDIKTTTHNSTKMELRDLVDPDPDDPEAHDWTNGEPAEVETEWRILQTEFAQPDDPDPANVNGELAGAPEELPDGDEIISRRYEFYKYTGPIDAESGEAMADEVGPDGIHGVGSVTFNHHIDPNTGEWVEETVDLTTVEVVGEFLGAQMSAFDVAPVLGLIDHIPDGEIGVPYADRRVVIAGGAAFLASASGNLPDGTNFDSLTGIFSGTPTAAGVFTFTVEASDTSETFVTKTYTVTIPEVVPDTSAIATSASPPAGGTTTGDGVYANGTPIIVMAANNPGFAFVNWTENGLEVSASANYPFTVVANRTLVANFIPTYTVATSASPVAGGTTSGDGVFNSGTSVTVVATPNPGYGFVNWTEGGGEVSLSASYTFTLQTDRTLMAHFILTGCVTNADCADADACTADVCVANVCENSLIAGCCNSNAECDDGDVCTRDACIDHECMFEAISTCCTTDAQCADADACTTDTCANFACQHTAVPDCCNSDAECSDENDCTVDLCVDHLCQREPVLDCCLGHEDCDDGDVCTADFCVNHVCENGPIAGCCRSAAECDDGDVCTIDACEANVCVHDVIADCCAMDADCMDSNACTLDSCNAATHLCEHLPLPGCCLTDADCTDGGLCTIGRCVENHCTYMPAPDCCDTDDQCHDGIDCTVDRCINGVCQHQPDDSLCGDGVGCTVDVCDLLAGCVNRPNDALCDDGLFCNGQERCHRVAGCRPSNRKPCPPPFCNEDKDICEGKHGMPKERNAPQNPREE